MTDYYRPLVQHGPARPGDAAGLAGGAYWFTHAELLNRIEPGRVVPLSEIPNDILQHLTQPRAAIAGLDLSRPNLMAILNVTPDSFSDGGRHADPNSAIPAARSMVAAGADLIDIGGESTRPGAQPVPQAQEIARIAPVIAALCGDIGVPVSVDTRKAPVARAAVDAGAKLVNDVSGFTYDPALAPLCAKLGLPVCVMHAQGDPQTMQVDPAYDDVLLDVFDFLQARVSALEATGIPRARIVVDPGIGFGKTLTHNIAILQGISLFHGLGCAILLGVSRKRFIGTVGKAPQVSTRAPGSIAVGLAALAQGVQILRAHDVAETTQAMRLWSAVW